MSQPLLSTWQLLVLMAFIQNSIEVNYEFAFDDERVYSDCQNEPGTLKIEDLFDSSNLTFSMAEDGVTISGNQTVVWDIQPSDRVELLGSVRYFDRGTWQPTTLNMVIKDFCRVMFDKKQVWYEAYSKHIKNVADIKDTCFRVKGRVIQFETYKANCEFASGVSLQKGRYAIRLRFRAYDSDEKIRPNEICFEIKGQFTKKQVG
ncbi:uncharacterized protein LOC6548922 [Drosophila erecta]|uniref:Uncharacterized protein n=1 Tax=Drosophila erecta TaxID=7220 RepID=B3NPI3_DROER|nr:uncharacterized protein LOC6548922 [Drosophila erecta]EDV55750.1 uncharacterized protein Dere_GG20608 [Drosophila erecta]